jgi:hypothetical protein
MGIYLTVFFLLSIILIYTSFSNRFLKVFTIIASMVVIFFESLRWKTGTDWNPYFDLFLNPEILTLNEPLYYLLNFVVSFFFSSYTSILFIISVFSILSLTYILDHFKINPVFGILIYFSLIIGYWGMNRQIFSLFCALYMYKSIIEKKGILIIFWFVIGVLFHNSFIFLIFLPFFNIRHYFKYILLFCFLFFIFFKGLNNFSFFFSNFSFLLEKHDLYSNLQYGGKIFLTISRRLPVSALIIYFWLSFYFNRKSGETSFIFFSYVYLTGFILTLFLYETLPIFVNRFSLYFMISEIFLVPYFFKMLESKNIKLLYMLFFICFYLYVFINNINYNLDLYDPYISIFDKLDRIMY